MLFKVSTLRADQARAHNQRKCVRSLEVESAQMIDQARQAMAPALLGRCGWVSAHLDAIAAISTVSRQAPLARREDTRFAGESNFCPSVSYCFVSQATDAEAT